MMLQHPWEYWKHNGDPHPWTPAILEVLETALKISPVHPGANHYNIHMLEASPTPQRALASADRLSKLMPSVSHMVHMPSHIYIRSGLYQQGIRVNEMSLTGYKHYLAAFPDVANNAPLYLIHNLHMQTACAMLGAGYDYSSKSADECRASFDTSFLSLPAPMGTYVQYVYMTPVINDVRFGKWEKILASAAIPGNYIYANTLWHWARGIAYARNNQLSQARTELQLMKAKLNEPDMLVVLKPFNSPTGAARAAAKLLEGIIAEQANDLATAAAALKEAVNLEDALIYNEPKDMPLPVRPYLGAVLLKAGSYADAEKTFNQDLHQNPNNHWGLRGLYIALQKQAKHREAMLAKKQLDKNSTLGGSNLKIVY
jgi:tetratricopeptide (TPR) repeat protein